LLFTTFSKLQYYFSEFRPLKLYFSSFKIKASLPKQKKSVFIEDYCFIPTALFQAIKISDHSLYDFHCGCFPVDSPGQCDTAIARQVYWTNLIAFYQQLLKPSDSILQFLLSLQSSRLRNKTRQARTPNFFYTFPIRFKFKPEQIV
jgi:hypothetical protein